MYWDLPLIPNLTWLWRPSPSTRGTSQDGPAYYFSLINHFNELVPQNARWQSPLWCFLCPGLYLLILDHHCNHLDALWKKNLFALPLVLSSQIIHYSFSDKLNLSKAWSHGLTPMNYLPIDWFQHITSMHITFSSLFFSTILSLDSTLWCSSVPRIPWRSTWSWRLSEVGEGAWTLFHCPVLPTQEESWPLFLGKRDMGSTVPGGESS